VAFIIIIIMEKTEAGKRPLYPRNRCRITNTCYTILSEPEEGPPPHPRWGGSCMLRGLMLRRRPFKMRKKICWSPGLRPGPRWRSLQRSSRPLAGGEGLRGALLPPSSRTPLTILSLCLSCVYACTHVYENALLFSLQC